MDAIKVILLFIIVYLLIVVTFELDNIRIDNNPHGVHFNFLTLRNEGVK